MNNFKLNDICYFERNGNIYKGVIWMKPLKYAAEYNVEYKSGSTIFSTVVNIDKAFKSVQDLIDYEFNKK